jgi:hypothetical protein
MILNFIFKIASGTSFVKKIFRRPAEEPKPHESLVAGSLTTKKANGQYGARAHEYSIDGRRWQEVNRANAGSQNLCMVPLSAATLFREKGRIRGPAMREGSKAAKKKACG